MASTSFSGGLVGVHRVEAVATGGEGGDAFDGARAGDGGLASLGAVTGSATSPFSVSGAVVGGRGGDGFSGADAGNGADASLVDAVFGPSAQLLAQNATGGNGGSSQGGAAGRGGSATSQFAAANATFDQSLDVLAVGGEGGDAAGADAGGAEVAAGSGGAATALGSLSTPARSSVWANALAGDGGGGSEGARGGSGADATAHAVASGSSDAADVWALSDAVAGTGGAVEDGSAAPGAGGNANAESTAEGVLGFANLEYVNAVAYAVGGHGGRGHGLSSYPPTVGGGGDATSRATARNQGVGTAVAEASAQGGFAGPGGDSFIGKAGRGEATAIAESDGTAFATARANSGWGVGGVGGPALARAEVDAPSGLASASAFSLGFDFGAGINASVGTELRVPGSAAVEARAAVGQPAPDRNLAAGLAGAAYGTALPLAADVEAALEGKADLAEALSGLETFGLGLVQLAAPSCCDPTFPPAPPSAEFAIRFGAAEGLRADADGLVVGLLAARVSGEFSALSFRVEREVIDLMGAGSPELLVEVIFSDAQALLDYFDARALSLGPLELDAGELVELTLSFELASFDPDVSFSTDFLVGAQIPEPASALLLALGLSLLAARRRAPTLALARRSPRLREGPRAG
jgi:hypothetical protein